jgi:hypothetical protein
MISGMTELRHKYLRHHKKFPHVWCPGCGNGIILGAFIRAIERLNLKKDHPWPGIDVCHWYKTCQAFP